MRLATAMLLFAIFPVSGTQASGLGRLFFTPEQRTQLEANLTHKATDEDATSSVLTVNGIVQQRRGARTVWINGAAQNSGHGDEPAAEAVAVPGKPHPVKIKVGQKLLLDAPPITHASAE